MSTKKISALTELTTTPAAGDLLPIVDISDTTDAASGTTKSIVPAKLFQAAGIGAGNVTTEPIKIDTSGGLVGIGASTPSAQLHLKKDANTGAADSFLQIENTNSSDDDYAGIGFQQHNAGGIKAWFGTRRNGASYGHQDFVFVQDSDDNHADVTLESAAEVMVIKKGGNVGIGTSEPSLNLNVSATDTYAQVAITRTDSTISDGDVLGQLKFGGTENSGTTWDYGIGMRGIAAENWTIGSASGSIMEFWTTPKTSTVSVNRMRISNAGNILIGGTVDPTSSVGNLCLFNGTAPAASVSNGVVLYAEDTTSSSELKVRDEAGNISTLSPHNFDLLGDRSEAMAWSYSAKNAFVGKEIAVDMTKVIRALEKLTGETYIKIRDIADSEKLDWATEEKKYEAERKKDIDSYKARKVESDAHPTSSSTKAEIKTFLDEKGISYADAPKDELFEKVPEKDAFTETEPAVYSKKSKPSWIG